MKVLVTGHKGFIGQNLCIHLIERGYEVEGYEYIPNVLPDCSQYDKVIHLGAISSTTERDVEKVMTQNLDFSHRILQLCDMQGVDFVYASSASVYGDTTHFTEDGPLQPQSPYAWSKYLFDRGVQMINWDDYQARVQGLRFFNVYGKYEDHKGDQMSVFHKFKKQALETGKVHPFENSDNYLRDFICVEDVCKIIETLLHTDKSGIWNLGTGKAESFGTIAKLIAEKYNADIETIPMPDALNGQYQAYTQSNNDKLLSAIGDYKFKTVQEWIEEWQD
jgi:ADP-L-glycero-D-manno-heptose 6-epimerase